MKKGVVKDRIYSFDLKKKLIGKTEGRTGLEGKKERLSSGRSKFEMPIGLRSSKVKWALRYASGAL